MVLAGVAPRSQAAPPTNDMCAMAQNIPRTGPFPYFTPVVNIAMATTNGDPILSIPFYNDKRSNSVWFRFTPAAAGSYTISSCNAAGTATTVQDTFMGLFTSLVGCSANVSNYTELAFDDLDNCDPSNQAAITANLLADQTYYIVVWKYHSSTLNPGTNLQLAITASIPPPNDTCATAIPLSLGIPVSGTTVGGQNDYRLPNTACFSGLGQIGSLAPGRDVVYSFTAPADGDYSFRTFNYAPGQNLVLYAAACTGSGNPVILNNCLAAANRNSAGTAEEILCLPLVESQQIHLFVDDATANNPGSQFSIEAVACIREQEPNDARVDAGPLVCGLIGEINPGTEEDTFALGQYPAGWRLFALVDAAAANLPDLDLEILTRSSVILEVDRDNNDTTFGDSSPNVAGTLLDGDHVFLRVTAGGTFPQPTGPYRLFAVVQPPQTNAAVESEPNDTLLTADMADINYFYGTLTNPAPSTDVDVFAFTAFDGDLVFLSLDGDPLRNLTPINPKLELLDEFGNVLATVSDAATTSCTNNTENCPGFPGEGLAYRCPAEGTYYARVSIGTTQPLFGAGDYLLSISRNCFAGSIGANTGPVLTNLAAPPSPEGTNAFLTGTILDPDAGQAMTLNINWGDGSNQIVRVPPGAFAIPHRYPLDAAPGVVSQTFNVSLSLTDPFGEPAGGATTATITNAPPVLLSNSVAPAEFNEGQTVQVSGVLADPGLLDAHVVTINWGDGTAHTVMNLPAGTNEFAAAHAYLDDKPTLTPFDITILTITVTDDDGGSSPGTVPLLISNVPPVLGVLSPPPFVYAGSSLLLTGACADISPLDTLTLTVDWGDGQPPQMFNYPAGTTSFSQSHQYTAANSNVTIQATLKDDDGGMVVQSAMLEVRPAATVLRFTSIQATSGIIRMDLTGAANTTYRIRRSTDLSVPPASWPVLGDRTTDGTGRAQIDDPAPTDRARFYIAHPVE